MPKYFDKTGNEVALESLQLGAEVSNMELAEYMSEFGFTSDEGKTNGSADITPPTEPEKKTAAGDSSLADTSLELQEASPYALSIEDVSGSEEEVYERLQQKLRSIGIEIEETGVLFDAIRLTSLTKKGEDGDALSRKIYLTDDRESSLELINKSIEWLADDTYAESLKEGRGDILSQHKAKIKSISVSDEDVKNWQISSWQNKEAEKQTAQMKSMQGAPMEYSRTSSELTSGDFETNREYEQYLKWKSEGVVDMTKEEIAKSKPIVLEEERNAASKEYVRSLSDEDREAVETIAAFEAEKNKARLSNIDIEIKGLNEKAISLQKDIDTFNANPVSEEQANSLRARAAEILIQEEELQTFLEEAETTSRAAGDLSKNYSMLSKLGVNFKKTGLDIGYGAFQVLMATGSLLSEGEIESGVKLAEKVAKPRLQDMQRELAGYDEGVQFSRIGKTGNFTKDVINWAGNTTVQAVPSLSLAFTGPAAMPLFFASGYGSTAADQAIQEYEAVKRIQENKKLLEAPGITSERKAEIEAAIDADAKIVDMPAWREMTTSTIAGAAEVAFERVGTIAILKGVNRTVSTNKKEIVKSILKSANQEGLTEAATELTNNWAKINVLGEEEVNLFDNIAESYFGGAIIGGPLELKHAMPAIYANIAHSAMTSKEIRDYKNKVDRIKKLTGIKNLDSLLNSRMPLPDGLSNESKKLIREVQEAGELLQDQAVQRLQKRLSSDEIIELGEINMRMRQINKRLTDAAKSGASQSELTAIKEELQNKFDDLNQRREALLTNQASQAETARAKTNIQASLAFAEASTIVFQRELEIKEMNSNIAFDLLDAAEKTRLINESGGVESIAKYNYFLNNNKKQLEEDYNRAQVINAENGKVAVIKRMTDKEFKQAFPDADETTTAFEQDGEIYVNEDAAAARGQVGVYTHEIFHTVAKQTIGDGKANEAGERLLEYLKEEAGEVYDYIKNKLDVLYTEDGKKDKAYYEEAMTALSDYVAEGNKIELGALTQVNRFLDKVFGKVAPGLSIKDGQQTFEFILQYASKNRGKKAEEALKNFLRSVVRDDEEELTDEAKDAAFKKKSRSASAARAAEKLAKLQEEGYDPNSLELYESLQGMVGAQLSKYQAKGLQITDEEEAVSDVVSRLYTQRDVNKFDGRGTLYGYLNGRIKFRILDALKANPVWVENFENIDVEGLEGKATRQVATEDVETEVVAPAAIVSEAEVTQQVNNRPEYKNLLRRRVVEPEVIKSIEDKVLRTVRLLKSRIDAQVSKNVTVVPIIREIKKEMGKQADIDFKTAMGGKKDGELRKFLLRNKAAILENMSTTWLSTAMPIAIQKKVDGVWTSDWKGKKIDRESTATDMAGRTSGAELVRRMPNAMRNISDADFLATILQPDGNPIRGKKESLAKAMAEEISFDIIKQALEDSNHPITQALIENQKRLGVENAENLGPEFVRLSERGNVKFSKSLSKNIALTMAKYDSLASRADKLELVEDSIDDLLSKYNVFGRYNIKNPEEAKLWVADIKENLVPLMPKNFWFPKEDNINSFLLSNKGVFNGLTKEQFESLRELINTEIRNAPDTKYGEPLSGIKDFNPQFKRFNKGKLIDLTARNILLDEESALWATESGTMLKYNVYAETVHRIMWRRIYDKIREDKNNARGIATWLAFSTNDLSHPQRNMIAIGGWSINFKREDVTLEHATPNVATLQALLDMSLKEASELSPNETGNWNFYYSAIASNYKLIALNQSDDNKAGKFFKSKMSAEYNIITGTWWDRYFNLYTAKVEGYTLQKDKNGKLKRVYDGTRGIEPKTIMLPSGKLLSEVTGIDKRGGYRYTKIADMIDTLVEEYGVGRFKRETRSIAAKFKVEDEAWENGKRRYSKSFPPPQVLSNQFNKILERKTGIAADQEFSRIRGQLAGKGKGRFRFFVAPGAEDFRGLVHYAFAGKGEQGDKDLEFFEKNLMEPYFKGIAAIDSTRQIIKREFKVVVDEYKAEYKMLSENIPDSPYTYDHALRVYLWASQGTNIPGLDAKDQAFLENTILDNPALADLGEALMIVGRKETWPKPSEFWEGDSVLADLNSMTEKVGRKEILSQFIQNADAIFTEANLNKIEAAKGRAHREAIEDALYSMKSGTNRPSGANQQMNRWLNWINGSTGAIMFFNRRSALLQMLSATNFINWSDNNPVKAAAAFADQKQYWKDFVYIFNSDKLKERRGGLKQDVSESEIAQVAGRSKNSPQAILSYLLKIGFTPTQIADSLAISMGGATFYRNRINTYVKQGMSQKDAEERAWLDFSKTSDEAQQSSDPALVSKEQRSVLGRLVLAFANTPMQYTRLMKKAGQDLINGRGDWKTNISKIAYYGFVQNFIFSALQGALFALAFDDEEDDEKAQQDADRKISRTIHSMIDTVVRGSGIYGAVATTIKNTILQYYQQEEKGYMADHTYTVLSAVGISPPIGSKLRKLYGAIQTRKFEKDNIEARGWALTANGRLNLGPNWAIAGQVLSGTLNVPLDRVVDELKSISEALDARNKAWQRIALALGWKTWDVGVKNEEADLIETQAKEARKQKGIEKAKETRKAKRGSREDRAQRAKQRNK